MAHQMTKNDAAASLYVGSPAWHRKGQVATLDELMGPDGKPKTFREIMVSKGLIYDVKPVEVFGVVLVEQPDGTLKEVVVEFPEYVGIYRGDNHLGLAIHNDGYTIGQNEELAAMLDAMNAGAHDGRVIDPEAFVSMKDGRIVAVTGKFRGQIVLPGGDVIDPYVVARTSHNGEFLTGLRSCMFRVVCRNTLNASMLGKAQLDFSCKHTLGREDQIAKGTKDAVAFVNDVRNFEAEARAMIEATVTDMEFRALVETVLPYKGDTELQRSKVDTQRAAVAGIWSGDERVGGYKGTAWGAFQAVSTWEQWVQPGKDLDGRNMTATLGRGFVVSNHAGRLLAPAPREVVPV